MGLYNYDYNVLEPGDFVDEGGETDFVDEGRGDFVDEGRETEGKDINDERRSCHSLFATEMSLSEEEESFFKDL